MAEEASPQGEKKTAPARGVATVPPARSDPQEQSGLLTRKAFIGAAIGVTAGCAAAAFGLSQFAPFLPPASLAGAGGGPVIFRDKKNPLNKIPVTVRDLPAPGDWPAKPFVIAEWAFLPAMIFVVPVQVLQAASKVRKMNTAQHAIPHPDDPNFAILAYIAKCKHLGCTVNWNPGLGASKDVPDYDGDGLDEGRILCPCHQGQYDIYNFAENVPGTPPPAPLDVIQISIGEAESSDGTKVRDSIIGFAKLEQPAAGAADILPQKEFALGAAVPEDRRFWSG